MKRFVFLLLTAWLLSSGFAVADVNLRGYAKENGYQYLAFGRFPQTADGKEQPILWRILSATDKEAYLLSEYILSTIGFTRTMTHIAHRAALLIKPKSMRS